VFLRSFYCRINYETALIAGIVLLVAGGVIGICLHLLGLDELDEIVAKVQARLK